MNKIIIALALFALIGAASGISCWVGSVGVYVSTSGFTSCYKYTISSLTTKAGSVSSCSGISSSISSNSGYSCCETELCNGAKMNGMSILLASAAAIFALFRAL